MHKALIKDLPKEERPRERLLNYGVESLSNEELIAIILKTGLKNESVKNIASKLLSEVKSIDNLSEVSINKLISIKGIGKVKAVELKAAIELGKRIYYYKKQKQVKMDNPAKIYHYIKYFLDNKKQEYFYCLYVDAKKNLIEKKLLFMGTLNRSVVHPREIFKEAYLLSASAIICIHNHPSGDVLPSKEDILFTKNLVEIGKIQGIAILDHIIVSDKKYYSFFQNNNI